MLRDHLKLALTMQAIHALLCVVWNVVGVWQIEHGSQSIGPTASLLVAAALVMLSILLITSVLKNWKISYAAVSLLLFLGALSAVYGGFTKDVLLWPSEFWRYAGIVVNAVGIFGFVLMAVNFIRYRRDK